MLLVREITSMPVSSKDSSASYLPGVHAGASARVRASAITVSVEGTLLTRIKKTITADKIARLKRARMPESKL